MGARTKMNTVAVNGSLIVAAIIGGMCQSWTVFVVAAATLIGGCLYAGDIRIKSQRPTNRRG
jgi:hypothetical protein